MVRWSWITLGLLLGQNLLGMGLNLYVDLSSYPTVDAAFRSAPLLDVHVLTAFAIVGTSAYVLVLASRARRPRMGLTALAGLGFDLLAFLSGVEFTFFGQGDAFSYLMEVGFAGTVGCVAMVLVMAYGSEAGGHPSGGPGRPQGATGAEPPETG